MIITEIYEVVLVCVFAMGIGVLVTRPWQWKRHAENAAWVSWQRRKNLVKRSMYRECNDMINRSRLF